MPRRIKVSLKEICDEWAAIATQNYRQQLSTIDAAVAFRLGVSVTTIRSYRKSEEGGLLEYIFRQRALHLQYCSRYEMSPYDPLPKRFPYRRLHEMPEQYLRDFERLLDKGTPPTVAFTEVATTAQSDGAAVPSLRSFLRWANPSRRRRTP